MSQMPSRQLLLKLVGIFNNIVQTMLEQCFTVEDCCSGRHFWNPGIAKIAPPPQKKKNLALDLTKKSAEMRLMTVNEKLSSAKEVK